MNKTNYFKYGKREIEHLKKADPILGEAIRGIGRVEREVIPDLFEALIYAIVGQQISVKAVHTIWNRMEQYFGKITPQAMASAALEEIQQRGLSLRKAKFIKEVGAIIARDQFCLEELYNLSDEEVIKGLCALPGIGVWTAEMLLLNSMERPDIVSWQDIAIKRGMMRLYGLKELSKAQFDDYRQKYSPYGSVASIYLWRLSFEK